MKHLLVLTGAAALVLVAVVGIAGLILSDGEQTAPSAGSDGPASGEEPPDAWETRIEVTGDRSGTIESDDTNLLRVADDPESGLYLDQMVFDGLNIFLDPGDCPLRLDEIDLSRFEGLARLTISCEGVNDVQGNNTIALEGIYVTSAAQVLPPPSDDTGGTLQLSGDVEAEMMVRPLAWYVQGDDSLIYEDLGDNFAPSLELTAAAGVVSVAGVFDQVNLIFFTAQPGDCSVETQPVEQLADRERVQLTIDCPRLESETFEPGQQPEIVSVRGAVLIDRIAVES